MEVASIFEYKFKYLVSDIVLMESPILPRGNRETLISCYDVELIDLTKYWKNKSARIAKTKK